MLALEGAGKRYGDEWALAPTDLVLPRGRTLALIGPSGSGKSTALRLLIGLVEPDEGRVTWQGTPLPRLGERGGEARLVALRRRIGFVVQGGGLFPHLSARDNVSLMARRSGWARERVAARVAELAGLVHLREAELARLPSRLSGGQRQRVALMRALMLDPDVLLLDEPLGALDPIIRSELQDELAQLFAALRKTVVLVTHDLAEAARVGDELLLLREGRIVQRGDLEDLVLRPADGFVRRFVAAWRTPALLAGEGRDA